jgi:hypothetical protein
MDRQSQWLFLTSLVLTPHVEFPLNASHRRSFGARELCGFADTREFEKAHVEWVEAGLSADVRDETIWSESIAVGSEGFVEQVKNELGSRAQHRQVAVADGLYTLREPVPLYGDHFDRENEALRSNNTVPWKTNLETTEA